MATQQQWGITPPISMKLPTENELKLNASLTDELKRQDNFEGSEETERRKAALQLIQKVTIEFVKVVSKEQNQPQAVITSAGGKIFTYGSYRLGVYGPGSDIDTLVVCPKHIQREDFFKYFPPTLERMSGPGAIEEMTPVPDAYVPIIKLEFMGISIDLIFARLAVSSVPLNLDLKDKQYLRGLDERDLRSVNGTRVTDEILELVPQQKTFRTALRAIKLWAQRRAIYANVMGFPGGVAWAMLVARVCQLYPQASGSVIVGKFFSIIGRWNWPQPILLKQIESGPGLEARVWNPKLYRGDRFHLMPIITPAYPSMCATHNITISTKKIIAKELERGNTLVDKIFTGQLQWKDLFGKHNFFTQDYRYYLCIVASSRTKEAQLLWSGLVESKVRHLVSQLEEEAAIEIAHPFNKGFERVHRCKNEAEIEDVIAGDLSYQVTDIKTETTDDTNDPKHNAVAQGDSEVATTQSNGDLSSGDMQKEEIEIGTNGEEMHTIYTTTYYIGIELDKGGSKTLDISAQTRMFKELCTGWASYDESLSCLNIRHTRNYDLPPDVFDAKDVRPVKPAKKKGNKRETSVLSKRSIDAADTEATQTMAKRQQVRSEA